MKTEKLICVYNADGGAFNALADAAHKLFSPSTYPCSLCAITYGAVSMRREWKAYIEAMPRETLFYHRDEFARLWPGMTAELPAIFRQRDTGQLSLLVTRQELNGIGSVAQLMALLDDRLGPACNAD